jgi:hypothetical protein
LLRGDDVQADSRFGRGGVIDDVLLTARDDFETDPLVGSLPSIGSAGQFVLSPSGKDFPEVPHSFREGSMSREEKERGKVHLVQSSSGPMY